MKYKILSAMVAGALLSACGESSNSSVSGDDFTAQAYDPAVAYMNFAQRCGSSSAFADSGESDYYGNAVTNIVGDPADCAFKFTGDGDSVDIVSGKSMDGVVYYVPKGLAEAGQPLTASPLTTALFEKLDGGVYTEEAATQLLTDLGLDNLVNEGSSVLDIYRDTETVASNLSEASQAQLYATTGVLSDVLKNNPEGDIDEIISTASSVSETVLADETFEVGSVISVAGGLGNDVEVTVTEGTPVENPDPDATGSAS